MLPVPVARIKTWVSNWPIHLKSEAILYLFPCHTGRLYKRLWDREWKASLQCRWTTHLRPSNTNVSVTHFIDDSDDRDTFVYHLP